MSKKALLLTAIGIIAVPGLVYGSMHVYERYVLSQLVTTGVSNLPVASPVVIPSPSPSPTPTPTPTPKPVVIKEQINLEVPFTMQAPTSNWDAVHEETCEEASALMAAWYAKGKTGSAEAGYKNRILPATAEAELQELLAWVDENYAGVKDINAEQTARMLKEALDVPNIRLTTNITQDSFKKELSQGNVIIIPAAGQLLKNPNFKPPGPPYHMLVIRGYEGDTFITNDPGTRRGEGYTYSWTILDNAIHDWTGSKSTMEEGKRIAIIVGK